MVSFRINKVVQIPFPPAPKVVTSSMMGIMNVDINYDSVGFFNGLGVLGVENYSTASQSTPFKFTFTDLSVKYTSTPGNAYTGGTSNRMTATLFKNGTPTSLKINVDNPSSVDEIITSVSGRITILPTDTWAVFIQPSTVERDAPSSGVAQWSITLVFQDS